MATVETVTWVCDVCKIEDDETISTHTISVDRKPARELDACGDCFATASLTDLLAVSRPAKTGA